MEILIADDKPEVRSALRLLLEQEPQPVTVTEVSETKGLLASLKGGCPAIVLLDWELPGLIHSDIQALLYASCPQIKVVAMSSSYEARKEALAAGVDAFVSKAEPPEQILTTLRSLNGRFKVK